MTNIFLLVIFMRDVILCLLYKDYFCGYIPPVASSMLQLISQLCSVVVFFATVALPYECYAKWNPETKFQIYFPFDALRCKSSTANAEARYCRSRNSFSNPPFKPSWSKLVKNYNKGMAFPVDLLGDFFLLL